MKRIAYVLLLALLLAGCAGKKASSIATDISWTLAIRRRRPIRA
jgi:PBP1b-binding outer membrane lipoprotein LpoB